MSEAYVTADYLRRAADLVRHIKERSYALMRVQPGWRVLDVGCGPGVDTVPLGERVGANGAVVGIDPEPEMLAQADRLAAERNVAAWVTHRLGEAFPLDFEDASFDACHAERLLQVLPAGYPGTPQRVLQEMARVTRPGGWVVVVDTDWATASVDFSEQALERRLVGFFAQTMRPNGFAGRQLLDAFRANGFDEVTVELCALHQASVEMTPFGDWLVSEARRAGIASEQELAHWQSELAERSRTGRFHASVNMVLVAGQRPAGVSKRPSA